MRRILSLEGRDLWVEARTGTGDATLKLAVEGAAGALIARAAPGGWTITEGRRTVEAGVIRERSGALVVQIEGHTYRFHTGRSAAGVSGPRRSRSPEPGGAGCEVRTPMPGKVVRVVREPGEQVAEGDGVLVFEAMKMQNEIRAPKAGVLANMKAVAGITMEGGELLFVVEPAESA